MAFNPFTSFRKYQKFWMASVLLISMITFVLCSGVGSRGGAEGDLGAQVLAWFRPRGEVVATFNGSNIYSDDMNRLREQRKLINNFMLNCKKYSAARLNDYLTRSEGVKTNAGLKRHLEQLRNIFEDLQREKWHFAGGTKMQDLLDFKAWIAEADRLGIELDNTVAHNLVFNEMLFNYTAREHPHFTEETFLVAQNEAIRSSQAFTTQKFYKALQDEFRVRMAKEAIDRVQPAQVTIMTAKEAEQGVVTRVVLKPRALPTPDQLWDFYQEKMGTYPVTLLPVKAEAFFKEVGEPTEDDLRRVFEAGRNVKYDPHSDKPGFEQPQRAKFAYITADPDSAQYKALARTLIGLRDYPVTAYSPLAPQATLLRLAAGAAAEEAALSKVYETQLQSREYLAPSHESSNLPLHLAMYYTERRPQAIASIFAGIAVSPQFGLTAIPIEASVDLKKHSASIDRAVREEVKRRLPAYAAVVPTSVISPMLALAANQIAFRPEETSDRPTREFLPLSIVRDRVEKVEQRSIATRYASDTVIEIRRKVESLPKTDEFQLARALQPYVADKRVELHQTEKAYSRFNVQNAKELEPLKTAFEKELDRINMIEGRKTLAGISDTGAPLDKEDFWKLLFDSGERFSVGNTPFAPKPFPPDLTPGQAYFRNRTPFLQQAMFGKMDPNLLETVVATLDRPENQAARIPMLGFAEKPFLFWKTEEVKPRVPESLAEVRDEVVRAWKLERAGDLKMLPYAEKVARELIVAGNPEIGVERLRAEADKMGTKAVTIPSVGEYVLGPGGTYQPFSVDKSQFDDPRDEIASSILSLIDLKKPLEFKIPAIDNLNKQLYDQTMKLEKNDPKGRFVQIIPNKPRTTYYLAGVGLPRGRFLQFDMFATSLGMAARGHSPISVSGRAMEDTEKKWNEAVLEQLRTTYRIKINASDETRTKFDTDISGGE